MATKKDDSHTDGSKKSNLPAVLFIIILAAGLTAIGFLSVNTKKHSIIIDETHNASTETPPLTPMPSDATETVETQAETATDAVTAEATTENPDTLAAMVTPRVLGDPSSPLEIREHSPLTCGHCANFHKTNLPSIKKDYIDTGKAHIVFDDFPLNGVALTASKMARCVPEKAYFNYIELLFDTQQEWATEEKYIDYLKQNAKLIGLSDAEIETCLNNKALEEALGQNAQKAHEKNGVSSTPTLVLNGTIVVPGLSPYEDLKKAFDAELEKSAAKPQ